MRRKKWFACISFDGKQRKVGHFDDEIEAAKAYDRAAKKYHEEFAALNFATKRQKREFNR